MAISQRHHYIPVFFIRGFITPSKTLWVYDKETETLSSKSPRSIFFEWNRNDITINGNEFDWLEKMAIGHLDNLFGSEFKIIQGQPIEQVEQQRSVNYIMLMAAISFYRTPATKEWTDQLTSHNLMQNLPSFIADFLNKARKQPLSNGDKKKIIDVLAPFINFYATNSALLTGQQQYKIVEFSAPCMILSDNPILFEKPPMDFRDLTNSIIFPLTSKRVYLGLRSERYSFNHEVLKKINILLAIHARRYFASEEKAFVEQVINGFHISKPAHSQFWSIAKDVFEMINK